MSAILEKFEVFTSNNSDYKVQPLGKLIDVFTGLKFRFQDKNVGKKATFVFYHPTDETKTRTVVLSSKLDAMYRAGKIRGPQLLGLTVVEMDIVNPTTKEMIAKDALRLQVPPSGVMTMGEIIAEDYVDAISGF